MPAASHSPSILAIETATELCSVALCHAGQTWQESLHAGQQHSQMLLPMIGRMLEHAGIGLAQLDAIAFGAGPGSFTGLRIACGVAQGLAFAHGLPVLPVPSLAGLALAGEGSVLCAVDARMGEVYAAHYQSGGATPECLRDAQVLKPEALMRQFDDVALDAVIGNAWERFPQLAAWAPSRVRQIRADVQPDAQQILTIALQDFAQGKAVAAEQASPIYVRNRIALTTEERAAGVRL